MTRVPADQAVRDRAEQDLDTSFVIEAGAGTGKTRLLVARLLALVDAGVPLERVVAITFTEKAASEMKLRLRDALGRRRGVPRVDAALQAIEVAPITTIHAFASGLLHRFPVEAGVDPSFVVADEARAVALRDAAWQDYVAEVLHAAPEAVDRALLLGFSPGHVEPVLRELAYGLASREANAPAPSLGGADPAAALAVAERILGTVMGQAEALGVPPDDTLVGEARRMLLETRRCREAEGAERDALLYRAAPWSRGKKGNRTRWRNANALEEARRLVGEASDRRAAARGELAHEVARGFVELALGFRGAYADTKAAASVLDFDDLLVATRLLLAASPEIRARVAADYDAIVVDEFQDTDPVQAEIVRHLAAGGGERPRPGRVFVVGDPKQSIYAFRGADIEAYAAFREQLRAEGGVVDAIQESFRPVRPLLDLANELAAKLLPAVGTALQPAHAPMTGGAEPAEARASVIVIAPVPGGVGPDVPPAPPGVDLSDGEPASSEPSDAEAAAVARLVRQAIDERWQVRDRSGETRAIRPGDVAILLPAMTAPLEAYERALPAEGLAYVVSGGKRFYKSVEVNALLAAVSAIDDPTNRLALVATLRSPLFGLSDDAIVRRAAGRGLSIFDPAGEDEVAPALRILSDLHRDRDRVGAARILGTLLDRTGTLGAFALKPHGLQRVHNLLKLVDEARRLSEAEGLSFRRLARMFAERLEGQHAAAQAPAAEAGQEAVEILTVHKAKGLEFGMVVLGALSHAPASDRSHALVQGGVAEACVLALGMRLETARFTDAKAHAKERRDAEARRLLYVALTRARDYLVLPFVPYGERTTGSLLSVLVDAVPEIAALASGGDADHLGSVPIALRRLDTSAGRAAWTRGLDGADVLRAVPAAATDAFADERRALVRRASSEIVHRAPSQMHGEGRGDPDDEGHMRPVRAARRVSVGAALGRAVHLALEAADLADTAGARALARAHARAEGLSETDAERATALVDTALSSAVLTRARAATRMWRELPFTLAIDGGVLEGIVDLAFEESGALVLVDYKTDDVPIPAIEARMKTHRPQLAQYALALSTLTPLPIREAIVLFLTTGESRTIPITPTLLATARKTLTRATPQGLLF